MAKRKSEGHKMGSWAFLIGLALALVFGALGSLTGNLVYILVVLGVIVGLLNIGGKEIIPFLWAGFILVIVATLGQGVVLSVPVFSNMLHALAVLFVPATIVVALIHVFRITEF